MTWNWEQPDWPDFSYDSTVLEPLEKQFLIQSGEFVGAYKHISPDNQETLKIDIISEEAVKTSEIEGEILNRDSVQSSLRHQLGLGAEKPGIDPAERGISEMMVDLYRNFGTALDHATLRGTKCCSPAIRKPASLEAIASMARLCKWCRGLITNGQSILKRPRRHACTMR